MLTLIFGIIALFLFFAYAEQVEEKHKIINAFRQEVYSAMWCAGIDKELAEKLEIQADGGDDPAAFVRNVIEECWKDVDNKLFRSINHRMDSYE